MRTSYGAFEREEVLENVFVGYGRMASDQRQKSMKRSTSVLDKLTICGYTHTRQG